MSTERRMKCRFCPYEVQTFYGNGVMFGANYWHVRDHVIAEHPVEWERFSGGEDFYAEQEIEEGNRRELVLIRGGAQWRRDSIKLPKAAELIFGE